MVLVEQKHHHNISPIDLISDSIRPQKFIRSCLIFLYFISTLVKSSYELLKDI